MTDTKLIASLFDRLNQNQFALGAAVEELSNWVEQRGSADLCAELETPDENFVYICEGTAARTIESCIGNSCPYRYGPHSK